MEKIKKKTFILNKRCCKKLRKIDLTKNFNLVSNTLTTTTTEKLSLSRALLPAGSIEINIVTKYTC